MNNEIAFYRFVSRSPIGLLFRNNRCRPSRVVLVYHSIDSGNPFCLDPKLFRDHIECIKNRYEIISLEKMIRIENKNDGLTVSLSFDDAYVSILENALPLLAEYAIPAIIYAPSNYIGKTNEWDKCRKKIMTLSQLHEAVSIGFTIGSHTQNHIRLRGLDQATLKYEIGDSKKALEDMLGIGVSSFAYPFGGRSDFDVNAGIVVRESGYSSAATGFFGRDNNYSNRFEIRRITVWPTDSVEDLEMKIEGCYDWLVPKEKVVHKFRRVLGQAS